MTIANKSDLVKRLREAASVWRDQQHAEFLREAADEIAYLRHLCRDLERVQRDNEDMYHKAADAIEHLTAHRESLFAIIARQALEIAQLRREQ